jgi:hypothetical protein
VIDGWLEGLVCQMDAQRLFVKGSVFRNQVQNGLWVIAVSNASVAVDDSFFENNGFGTGYFGLWFDGGFGRVTNTVITGNGGGAIASSGSVATFQRCEVSGNAVEGLGSYNAIVRVSQSTITRNGTGLLNSLGTLESFSNNVVRGNTSETSGTVTPVGLQ